jgi:hypothetical protein
MDRVEELIFEDVELVFISAFDLGDKVEVDAFVEALATNYPPLPLIVVYWVPPKEPSLTSVAYYLAARNQGLIDNKMTLSEFINRGFTDLLVRDEIKRELDKRRLFFDAIIENDKDVVDPEYFKLSRYARLKLIELEAEVVKPDEVEHDNREIQKYIREKVREFKIEPYCIVHSAGVGVLTAWINLKGEFTTDDIIRFENHLYEIKLNIKDEFGNQYKLVTLRDFIEGGIAIWFQTAILSKNIYGNYNKVYEKVFEAISSDDKMIKELAEILFKQLRVTFTTWNVVVGIRKIKCSDGCIAAEHVIKSHVKEIVGILSRSVRWRNIRVDAALKDLKMNLSIYEPFAMYLSVGSSLFLGSDILNIDLMINQIVTGSAFYADIDNAFKSHMLLLVTPVEFLMLSYKILDAYRSLYYMQLKKFQERKRKGETVNPSEYIELRRKLTDALQEYSDVAFFTVDPCRTILEYGKEMYKLGKRVNELRIALTELAELVRTHYDERIRKSQELLTIVFGVFGIFAMIEFFESLVGLVGTLGVVLVTATALFRFYRWYMGDPSLKQFLLIMVPAIFMYFMTVTKLKEHIGLELALVVVAIIVTSISFFYDFFRWYMSRPYRKFWPLRQRVGRAEKTQKQVRQPPRKETEK